MTESANEKSNHKARVTWRLVVFALFMFGFGYALVPLYDVLCNLTGINGKTGGQAALSGGQVDKSRSVEVQFLATRNAKLPWDFYPKLKSVTLHPGENKKIEYVAKNNSDHTMTVQAIPSVTPGLAANYLRKTECFCFNQQTLKSGQSMDMPLIFHLDPELPSEYHTVTLSYTLFDAGKYLNKKSKKPVGKIS